MSCNIFMAGWLENGGPGLSGCIPYLKMGDFPAIAMLVYQRVCFDLVVLVLNFVVIFCRKDL